MAWVILLERYALDRRTIPQSHHHCRYWPPTHPPANYFGIILRTKLPFGRIAFVFWYLFCLPGFFIFKVICWTFSHFVLQNSIYRLAMQKSRALLLHSSPFRGGTLCRHLIMYYFVSSVFTLKWNIVLYLHSDSIFNSNLFFLSGYFLNCEM